MLVDHHNQQIVRRKTRNLDLCFRTIGPPDQRWDQPSKNWETLDFSSDLAWIIAFSSQHHYYRRHTMWSAKRDPLACTRRAVKMLAITNLSQVSDRLSSTGKFMIAASHRSRVFGTSISSSFSPLVSSCFILAPSDRWRSVESARDGAVCRRDVVQLHFSHPFSWLQH